jgi:hypothetical protein
MCSSSGSTCFGDTSIAAEEESQMKLISASAMLDGH